MEFAELNILKKLKQKDPYLFLLITSFFRVLEGKGKKLESVILQS